MAGSGVHSPPFLVLPLVKRDAAAGSWGAHSIPPFPWLLPSPCSSIISDSPAWLQAICSISAGCVQGRRLGSCQQPRPAQTRQHRGSAPSFQPGLYVAVTQLAAEG